MASWPTSAVFACRRPSEASSTRWEIVCWASDFVEPMRPTGPRLIQPVAYTPGITGADSSFVVSPSMTRPSTLGTTPARSSKGRPGIGEE